MDFMIPILSLAALGMVASAKRKSPGSGGARRGKKTAPTALDQWTAVEVVMPRAMLSAREALIEIHRQTGIRYVVTHPRLQGFVGPYEVGGRQKLIAVVKDVAGAGRCSVAADGAVLVFEPAADRAASAALRSALGMPNGGNDTKSAFIKQK